MRYAIFSDIHANWQAWCAVRTDLRAQGAATAICLGDVIGYGPSPLRVLRDVRQCCDNVLFGNHEAAALGQLDLDIFTPEARRAAEWTATQLDGDARRFLGELPMVIEDEDILFVHAEPVAPEAWGYVETSADALACFQATQARLIFVGHTHFPEVFTLRPAGVVTQTQPAELTLDAGARYLVNVGSVGDPRDGTAQASYCLYDTATRKLKWRRVPFDLDALANEVRQRPQLELPWFLQERGAATARRIHAIRVPMVAATPIRITASRARMKVNLSRMQALASPAGPTTRPAVPPAAAPAVHPSPPRPPRKAGHKGIFFIGLVLAALLAAAAFVYLRTAGTITLTAQQAALAGRTIRLEKKDNLPVHIAFWSQPADAVTWTVPVQRAGTYAITFVYALAPRAGASSFDLRCGSTRLLAQLPTTGSWYTFRSAEIGRIALAAGTQTLVIRANGRIAGGLMNLRAVKLHRVN